MNVKCIRFLSAENIVADLVEETDDYITIRDAIVAMPIEDGSKVGFAPFAPLQDPNESEPTIPKSMVMYITKVHLIWKNNITACSNGLLHLIKKIIV